MPSPLLLYLFNEASSGTTPTVVHDTSSGTAANMNITYGSGSWTSVGGGDGMLFDGTTTQTQSSDLSGGKVQTAMQNNTQCTFEVVFNPASTANPSCGGVFWTGSGDPLIELSVNSAQFNVSINAFSGIVLFPLPDTTNVHVLHAVVDTTQATAANRILGYVDGVAQTPSINTQIPQNQALDHGETWSGVASGTGANIDTTTSGAKVYYWALYSTALTPTQVANNATALLANNDANPNGPTINTQPVQTVVISGNTATFTVSATASSGSLSYQWTKNGSNVGTSSNSYTTPVNTNSNNLDIYQVAVTDSIGTINSSAVYLIVIPTATPVTWLKH